MTNSKLAELLDRGRGPLGPMIELDFGLPDGPLRELATLLSAKNGFFLFNGGVSVFRAGEHEQGMGPELLHWNMTDTWKDTYRGLADDFFCFGQDIFGVQFAIRDNAEVVTFDPESAEVKPLGDSLEAWAAWLLADPDVRGAAGFARAYQNERGALEVGQRLVPLQFFVVGGSYDFDNFVVKDAVTAMRIRGPFAQQVHKLPDVATTRIVVS